MLRVRLDHGPTDFGTTVGAFIGEVDLRHAPMRFDVPHMHRKPDAARTNDESRLDIVVMMDIGWHLDSPTKAFTSDPDPNHSIRARCKCDHELWRTQEERL